MADNPTMAASEISALVARKRGKADSDRYVQFIEKQQAKRAKHDHSSRENAANGESDANSHG
jgi:hypothetical protein